MTPLETPANRLPPTLPGEERVREEEASAEVLTRSSLGEAIGGLAAVVLAIVALCGLFRGI
jgi:hypothetical protein